MNRLANESSPYLRQHADNPVHWYPWGDDAFKAAKLQDKPILLSVGYAACHWCHVMAHESFEDDATAKLMNEWFINIKVDREERPDVDSVYMEAVQAMTGQGGWPMTVFLTPDAKPFFAGTYFPKESFGGHRSFIDVLTAIDEIWRTRRADIETQASQITEAIAARTTLQPADRNADVFKNGEWWIDSFISQLHASHDKDWGGFGAAPKFPPSMALETLLRSNDEADLQIAINTLDAMASGGIYDHIGGGFHRYSVDNFWMVPHFEKMLYDQALLARCYLHAYLRTGEVRFRQIATETIEFVLRDLRNPNGGYYSALDADSKDENGEPEEGLYYIWRPSEIEQALGDPMLAEEVSQWYGVTKNGNFEGANILHRPERGDLIRPENIENARASLLNARYNRTAPLTDDKVITEWNAMFIATLAESGAALSNNEWVMEAERSADFLVESLFDGQWKRSWHKDTGARTHAFAADHAWLIDMFTRLGELTGKSKWRKLANETASTLIERFWDSQSAGVFTTPNNGEQLIIRQKEFFDGAIPSANSAAAYALTRLSLINGDTALQQRAESIISAIENILTGHPTAFPNYFLTVDLLTNGATATVIAGDHSDMVELTQTEFLPRNVLLWGERDSNPNWEGKSDGAYVCRNQTCGPVITSAADLRRELTS